MPDVVSSFRAIAQALAFNPTEYEQFVKDISAEIQRQMNLSEDLTALALSDIRAETSIRFFQKQKQ